MSRAMTPKPGEIYWGCVPGEGKHPVVVVSAERFNRGKYLTVVPVSSQRFHRRRVLPNCVEFVAGQFDLTENCVAQCENILTIHIDDLDVESGALGCVSGEKMRDVIRAIGHVIEADCEPSLIWPSQD